MSSHPASSSAGASDRGESAAAQGRLPLFLIGRSGVGCYCVQVRWFDGYRLIWPTNRTTRLWRRLTG